MKLSRFKTAIFVVAVFILVSACTSAPNRHELGASSDSLTLPQSKLGLAAVNDGTYIYVLGGSASQSLFGDINIIEPQLNTVKTLKNKVIPRRYHSAVYDGKESIFIIGGVGETDNGIGLVTQVEVFNIQTEEVTIIDSFKTPTRINTAVFHAGKIYVLGGDYPTRDGLQSTAAMFVYDIANNNWSRLADMPTAKATRAVVKDGFIYVVGGYDNKSSLAVFERYDISGKRWETLAPLLKGISAHSITVAGNGLYTFGNYDYLDETFAFNFDTQQWRQTDIGYLPSRHNAASTINGVTYVIGGTIATNAGELALVQTFILN